MIFPCIEQIIDREAGYVVDQGGPTNMGITIPTLAAWRNVPAAQITADDIKRLARDEARAIYEKMYILDYGYHRIENHHTRGHVVDAAVNHGPGDATRWAQKVAGAEVDGIFGPRSARAVNTMNAIKFNVLFGGERMIYMARITQDDPARNLASLEGWIRRAAGLQWRDV